MNEKLRWAVARLLNRLPGQCWADLVRWAMRSGDHGRPWSPIGSTCRDDASRCGSCYCGKLRARQNAEEANRG